jgi:hypothetical protein
MLQPQAADALQWQGNTYQAGQWGYSATWLHRDWLINGDSLPWQAWYFSKVPPHAAAPVYRRILNGHWAQILEIHGEWMLASIIPWPAFVAEMHQARYRMRRYYVAYRGECIGALVCLLMALAGFWIGLLGMPFTVVGLPLMGMFLRHAFQNGMALRKITVVDPGPYMPPLPPPTPDPIALPFGTSEFVEDTDEAVREMGKSSFHLPAQPPWHK